MPWLVVIYVTAGIPMAGLEFSSPGEAWYALARDMGFAIAAAVGDGGAGAVVLDRMASSRPGT